MRVRILGAGIVGLAVAEELLRRGHDVVVHDPSPATGASYAAAGMLSPAGELWHGEGELFRLGLASAAQWPAYAEALGVALQRTGTVLVGRDAADLQEVDRRAELLRGAGVAAESLTRRELVAREPGLGRVAGGVLLPEDHSVDPREVLAALRRRVPVEQVEPSPVVEPSSVVEPVETPVTVVATGARLPAPFTDLVRPVRGEILRVRTDDPLHGTVRGWAHGQPVYAVPRRVRDGWQEVAIGATSEEHGGDPAPHVEGVFRLLEAARALLPGLDRAVFDEAIARDRPATADHLPLVGPTHLPGVVLAAGHHRAGVLLAPLTARLVADHLETGAVEPALDPRRTREGDT
ncbi:FAD-binding oxidoreductase [Nocardioides panacisoli]|uniref:FAD-dependent oxidoreductase n=1 Tax=Nocardioides panacisoli TaxID=627624 RepID=UPI001C63850F|nr:FAD-dependent oxidoreductase [Nocardioides panacisoli]QYJ02642.1 FAD-binding oxidoreductase [Nocardioides panacisoli]